MGALLPSLQVAHRRGLLAERDTAALQLAFYLASWGMYRGSGFLLRRAYTVHVAVVERIVSPESAKLWRTEVGAGPATPDLVKSIIGLVDAVKDAYVPFGKASDILATKVILGTVGCLPAVDRFFISGLRKSGRPYSSLNRAFVEGIIGFCNDWEPALRKEQARIQTADRVHYPLMKLADMYFWQVGYDTASPEARRKAGSPE